MKNKSHTMMIKFQNKYGKEMGYKVWIDWKKKQEQQKKFLKN